MDVTHDALAGQATTAGRFARGRLLRLDRVLLSDLEPLVRLHAAITDEFGALDAPGGRDRVVAAAAALDHVLGGLDAARVVVGAVLLQEHVVDDKLLPGLHLAHRAVQQRRVVGQVGELELLAGVAGHVQTLEQLGVVRRGEQLLAPDALGRHRTFRGGICLRGVTLRMENGKERKCKLKFSWIFFRSSWRSNRRGQTCVSFAISNSIF